MKKIIIILLTLLLIGVLTACAADTRIEDYQILDARFHEFRDKTEIVIDSETTFMLLAVDDATLHSDLLQIQTQGLSESMEVQRTFDENGRMLSKIEAIFTGGAGYFCMDYFMTMLVMDIQEDAEEWAEIGVSTENVSQEWIFGDTYTHYQLSEGSLAQVLEDLERRDSVAYGLYGAFSEADLEEYLSYTDGVFRIEIVGEDIGLHIDTALEAMALNELNLVLFNLAKIVDIDEETRTALESDFSYWLRSADLEDARLVVERKDLGENTYQQDVGLYVPGRVAIAQSTTITVGNSPPVLAPPSFLTEDELSEQFENWVVELMVLAHIFNPDNEEDILSELFLDPYIVVTESGEKHTVMLIYGADVSESPNWIELIYSMIMMTYEFNAEYSIYEIMEDLVYEATYHGEGMEFIIPLELSDDSSLIKVGVIIETPGEIIANFVIVQDLPDSEYIFATTILLDNIHWSPIDTAILFELSEHYRIDFLGSLPDNWTDNW